MKADGCGGHGLNTDGGRNPRDETCEWCQRWEWEPNDGPLVHLLRDAVCAADRCGHQFWDPNDPRFAEDRYDSYELGKHEWRYAGQLLDFLQSRNVLLVEARPCRCGQPLAGDLHQNILTSDTVDGKHVLRPARADQHPYEPQP